MTLPASSRYKDSVPGICHLCCAKRAVIYCRRCGHWFCEDCREDYFHRGLAAIEELVKGKKEGCCGPS